MLSPSFSLALLPKIAPTNKSPAFADFDGDAVNRDAIAVVFKGVGEGARVNQIGVDERAVEVE